jgi:translation initiation factor IF-3
MARIPGPHRVAVGSDRRRWHRVHDLRGRRGRGGRDGLALAGVLAGFEFGIHLDLVEVADKANPPVCRIMDYGKYKYEAAQKAKESRKKSTNVVVKEMKYRPKIGVGDFDTKTKKVEQFLTEGHKVKVTIMFRGREMQHPELGRKILDQVAEAVTAVAKIEAYPRLDGRNMTMVLGPDKKAQAAAEKRRSADDSETPVASTPMTPEATAPEAAQPAPAESIVAEPVVTEPIAAPVEATEPVATEEA